MDRHCDWSILIKGKHLNQLDISLPAKRSLRVYGSQTRHEADLLAQLRTGHSWLAISRYPSFAVAMPIAACQRL